MRPTTKYLWVFILLTLWDWLAVAGTRMVAGQSIMAIPLYTATSALWWVAVRYCQDVKLAPVFFVSAALGAWLGILFP